MISPRYAQARLAADPWAEYDEGDFADALVNKVLGRTGRPAHFCMDGLLDSLYLVAEALESRLGRTECRIMVHDGEAIVDIAGELAAAVEEADQAAETARERGIEVGAELACDDSYSSGVEDGRHEGHSEGYTEGYTEGYEEGQAEAEGIELSCPQCAGSLDESLKCDSCCREFSLVQKGA